jgi:hypothetical protein
VRYWLTASPEALGARLKQLADSTIRFACINYLEGAAAKTLQAEGFATSTATVDGPCPVSLSTTSSMRPGPSDAATYRGTFCSSPSMMPLPVTLKRSTHVSVTCRKAWTTPAPGLPRVASRRRLADGASDQSPWPAGFRSTARSSPSEIVVIWLGHGTRAGRVEPGSLSASAGRQLPVHAGTDQAYAAGQVRLDRAENLGISGADPTAVCVDHGLGNVVDLDVAVLGETDEE